MGSKVIDVLALFVITTVIQSSNGNTSEPESGLGDLPAEPMVSSLFDTAKLGIRYDYEIPDLEIITSKNAWPANQIEAFKSNANAQILKSRLRTSELRWASFGSPQFVKSSRKGLKPEMFHPTSDGYRVLIKMLTREDQVMLAKRATKKYGSKIEPEQIVNAILAVFQCTLNLVEPFTNEKYLLKGTVSKFTSFPLRMDFYAPVGSVERELFEELLADTNFLDSNFECKIAADVKDHAVKSLSLGYDKQQEIGLYDKIFKTDRNDTSSVVMVYMTRKQIHRLGLELYLRLDIGHEFVISPSEFSDNFDKEIVQQVVNQFPVTIISYDQMSLNLSAFALLSLSNLNLY